MGDHETKSIFGTDKRLLFVFLCLITLLLLYVRIIFIENETAVFEFLQDRPAGTILQLINALKFFSIPLVYAWKFTVIAFVLWVGCFMFGYRITFAQCWGIVIAAEFIFVLPEIIKIVWFLFIKKDPSYSDIRAFYPLSLSYFFDYYQIDKRWAYPLRALNAFEIIYWIILAEGIHFYIKKEKRVAWFVVAGSYITIFVLWLGFYVIVYK